jgi:regulator of replication initiation timing
MSQEEHVTKKELSDEIEKAIKENNRKIRLELDHIRQELKEKNSKLEKKIKAHKHKPSK